MRPLVTLAAAAILLCSPCVARASGVPGPLADLRLQLAAMSLRAPGEVAMEVKDLDTGLTSAYNPTASMPAASTIKIPIMVEVFRQLAAGNFDFNTRVTLRTSDKDWGSGSLCDARAGTRYRVTDLLRAMITVSDNTASNMLIGLVGRPNINRTMLGLGLSHTRLGDYIRTSGTSIRHTLRSSPSDMVALLTQMAEDRLVDEWSSKEMIAILSGQRHNTLIPQPLPSGVQIAHKTGMLTDTLNDVGIVYAAQEPYVIAVMTTHLPSLGAGRRFIRGVSRVAYRGLERFALWRENNAQTLDAAQPQPQAAPVNDSPPSETPGATPAWEDSSAPSPAPSAAP